MSDPNLVIRPITEHDISGYHTLLGLVARERKYLRFLDAPPLDSTRAFVLMNIDRGNPHFVAEHDGQIIGWCDITRETDPSCQHVGTLGMGLHPDFRGLKIGEQLARTVVDEAKTKGFVRIELTVNPQNNNAIRLYEKLGFQHEGVMKAATYVDGEYRDVAMMAMVVSENSVSPT
jgi:RimJ/RimL family protein N-acetyltransferase